jgi:hypothetical protein
VQPSACDSGPICEVQEGMQVLDQEGQQVGSVSQIKIGDPDALTAQGQVMDLDEPYLDATRPALPGPLAERFLRIGFIKVSTRGLLRRPLYASSEQIDRVESGAVHLSVPQDSLAAET